jgi:hypothetical protein
MTRRPLVPNFVKVGGIAEKWMPLPRFSNLRSQSGTGLLGGGFVDFGR